MRKRHNVIALSVTGKDREFAGASAGAGLTRLVGLNADLLPSLLQFGIELRSGTRLALLQKQLQLHLEGSKDPWRLLNGSLNLPAGGWVHYTLLKYRGGTLNAATHRFVSHACGFSLAKAKLGATLPPEEEITGTGEGTFTCPTRGWRGRLIL